MRLDSSFVRFLISGGVNTVGTYLLYLGLLRLMPYWLSYAIAFVCGIALAYLLNRFFVFGAPRSERKAALLPLVYLAQYGVGAVVVYGWVAGLHWPPVLAPLASLVITVPLNFAASRWLFR